MVPFKTLLCGVLTTLLLGFTSCIDKKSPEYIARQFLIAAKKKDWETAMKYSTKELRQQMDMMKALGTDFGITEIKNVKCEEVSSNEVICTFCCSSDSTFDEIHLLKSEDDEWKAHDSKIYHLLD